MKQTIAILLGLASLWTIESACAGERGRTCDALLASDGLIDWVMTSDPMFRTYGIDELNRLDGPLCVSKSLVNYLRHLGYTPSPDRVLGMVCRYTALPLADLGRFALDDEAMRSLLRKSIHWLSEDQGLDDGYFARGTATERDREPDLRMSDLLRANSIKHTVLLKMHRWAHAHESSNDRLDVTTADESRWVVLRRVIVGRQAGKSSFAQLEDPTRPVLVTGRLTPLPKTAVGFETWAFEPEGNDRGLTVFTALLSSSLGIDEE